MVNLSDFKQIHCIGIGGIGLSAIAEILLSRGYRVTGSDMRESDITAKLAEAVKWTYTIEGQKEKAVKTLTLEEADELLGTEVKGYSESPELVQTLLNNQKGIV